MFFRAIFLSALAVAAADVVFQGSIQQPPIAGGSEVSIRDVPYHVRLQFPNDKFCSGAILSREWVITVAHCLLYSEANTVVWAGSASRSSGGSKHNVQRIFIHENHTVNDYTIPLNDVAVLKVSTPFDLDDTRKPIKFVDQDQNIVSGTKGTVTGWGALARNDPYPENLHKVTITVFSKAACDNDFKTFGGLTYGQICAGEYEGGIGICNGDGGGPLIVDGRLAGMASWNYGCAVAKFPGIYTEVASYSNWITGITGVKP